MTIESKVPTKFNWIHQIINFSIIAQWHREFDHQHGICEQIFFVIDMFIQKIFILCFFFV